MDMLKNIPVVHLNTADSWRGGEKQTYYLTSILQKRGYLSYCICRKNSPLHEKLSEAGLLHFPVISGPEFDFFAAKKIANLLKKTNAAVLHMHTAHAHSIGYLSNFFYKVPHNIVSRRVDYHINKNILSKIKYGFPDAYIAVSNAIKDVLVSDSIPAGKVTVVYSGVDLNQYKKIKSDYLRSEFNSIPDINKKVKLVNVAALTHQKDHETLIKAVKIASGETDDFILFIAGSGGLMGDLVKLRDDLGLRNKIIFTGFRADTLNLIHFGDIFVISSRMEGLGTSIIDAMALKKPVVASEAGGIPELIRSHENGILFPKENPDALAKAIIDLMRNRTLREKLSGQAHRDAKKFSIENTADNTMEIYRQLCGV